MKIIILFTFLLFTCVKCFSQDIYRTFNGHVIITGEFNDTTFLAESHYLEIYYNSNSQSISGKINLKSIISGIPYLDSILVNSGTIISIAGNIPVDFLTWKHKQYNLDIELDITMNGIKTTTISNMKFTHTDRLTNYTCVMEAAFKLDLADFKVDKPEQLSTNINVQFLQLILRREN